ncbi:hypothetical protein E4U57_004229 [Claviceps arundinis]|uniref:BZIP domain-containing protein n=1 Tax=Claviceps arundinis TaxID=1623583 RepID=A0ABQ7P5C1_9HYPO|nr:hypothetical protein E4U57_004229 [Claviceps arundinis]
MSGTDVVHPFELGRLQIILPIRAAPSRPAELPRRRNSAGQQTLQGTRPVRNRPGNNRRLGAHDSARESREARKKQRPNGVASTCFKKKKQSRKETMDAQFRMNKLRKQAMEEELRLKEEELRQKDEENEYLRQQLEIQNKGSQKLTDQVGCGFGSGSAP